METSYTNNEAQPQLQGWRCPVCGKVYSPYVDACQNEMCGVCTQSEYNLKNRL